MTKQQFEAITKWQEETFGEATASSKVAHLHEEVSELYAELHSLRTDKNRDKDTRMEFADCFLLLFGAAKSYGMTYEDVCGCINEKFEIVKKRKWGKPDANGVVKHIKD